MLKGFNNEPIEPSSDSRRNVKRRKPQNYIMKTQFDDINGNI